MTERWRPIIGYECIYLISSYGRVRSYRNGRWGLLPKPKLLKPSLTGGRTKYLCVNLFKNSKPKMFFVHKLVAQYFILNPDNKPHVNHKDGIKENNLMENLEWVTKKEDVIHAHKTGLNRNYGEGNHLSKLTEQQVLEIKLHLLNGMKQKTIAKLLGTSPQTVTDIKKGKTWKHI